MPKLIRKLDKERKPVWKIYFLQFGNSVYIGQTKLNVSDRIKAHRYKAMNRRLHQLLYNSEPDQILILGEHDSKEAATKAETGAIDEFKALGFDLINRFRPGREGADLARLMKHERKLGQGWWRCNVCLRRQPAEEFYSDRTRTSGLCGRCIDCIRWLAHSREDCDHTDTPQAHCNGCYARSMRELRDFAERQKSTRTNVHPSWTLPPRKPWRGRKSTRKPPGKRAIRAANARRDFDRDNAFAGDAETLAAARNIERDRKKIESTKQKEQAEYERRTRKG